MLAGKANGDKIPKADLTPEMQHGIKGAVEKLEAGEFDDVLAIAQAGGRTDFVMIVFGIDKLKWINHISISHIL